ncbi:MAG: glycoside hydrolase family 127 protein [Thermorudis peleae]|nr:glycoside hydrolase family 127 protein [Thermorudis peleae]
MGSIGSLPSPTKIAGKWTKMQAIVNGQIRVNHGFWHYWGSILKTRTVKHQYEQIRDTGRLDNFKLAAQGAHSGYRGLVFNDSDVYKWLEAASWLLASHPDEHLMQLVDETIDLVRQAQQEDGYLNTFYTLTNPNGRWSRLERDHELYCAGHLIQAAVAHHRVTGKRTLLDVACRFADLICDTFGPSEEGKRPGTDGHPEIEMALVELARETGNQRYLRQAQYFLNARGYGLAGGDPYRQDHVPFRQLDAMVGHAVRAVYLAAGAADIYAETGDPTLMETLLRLWHDMTTTKLYVTGGIGARYEGESFGNPYELPNARAYAETCAAVGLIFWAWRMLLITGESQYADILELALYNGALAGIGLDGTSYFYVNPLADDGTHRRQPWFECACCPPNIARLLASLPGYCYSISPGTIWVNLYISNEANLTLPDGLTIRLQQSTDYPWGEGVEFTLKTEGEYTLACRIPQWCTTGAAIQVNGMHVDDAEPGKYAKIRRQWRVGDRLTLSFPMPPRRLIAHPFVSEDRGCTAITRGPLIYCLEGADHPGIDLRTIQLPRTAVLHEESAPAELGGIVAIRTLGISTPLDPQWNNQLYRYEEQIVEPAQCKEIPLRFIPYFAWANRTPGQMTVWVRESSSPNVP